VPVTLFYEPVKKSGAIMTAFPSPVILDGDRNTTQSLLLRIAEASGQQALTMVKATLGEIEKWGGGATLPISGEAQKSIDTIPAAEQRYVSWNVGYPNNAKRGKYVGTVTLSSNETADLPVPVVALVRASTETVSLYEGPSTETATIQKSLTIEANGKAQTWVHVPKNFHVVYAALGVVGASANLMNPSLDIGADGSEEWAFSGKFDLGVLVNHVEEAFNDYMTKHQPEPDGWNVPIEVSGPAGEKILLNGIQLYLDIEMGPEPTRSDIINAILGKGNIPNGDVNGDGKVDVADLVTLIINQP
jgi:hypothetical protein